MLNNELVKWHVPNKWTHATYKIINYISISLSYNILFLDIIRWSVLFLTSGIIYNKLELWIYKYMLYIIYVVNQLGSKWLWWYMDTINRYH